MADSQEAGLPKESHSLEDDIFAVASSVEREAPGAGPRVHVRRPEVRAPAARDLRAGAAGFGTFLFVDLVMMWAPVMMSDRPSTTPQMVTLLVLAFGLGGLLAWKVGGAWRPFGYGMMTCWLFLTLVSVGFLTGIGP
ncbi:hypothetical protein [Actinomadura parmotrematis]|uniref:Uncharacterized protein n=1 Tax=Actinomadura parmotrematis TaxID=2864039 RepID=A0ABS7FNA8_9ACTN|nr:hypothetical protein [Actinomadura parmotrematis]MBW8481851.1 hypothetical protein [Actinomadura parmotrematis]